MRIAKPALIVLVLLLFASADVRLSAQLGQVFPNTPDVQTTVQSLEKKAAPDECWAGLSSGIAQFTNPNTANPPCSNVFPPAPSVDPMPKVNQGYVWGLTETSTHAWFGTFANGQCVTQAGVVSEPTPFVTTAYVCEFGASPYVPVPLPSGLIGDFRPARGYSWNKTTKALVDVTPVKAGGPGVGFTTATNPEGIFPLWGATRGIRAATTVPNVPLVVLAGPHLDPTQGLTFFAWNSATGAFLGGRRVLGYSNIRHFTIVDGVLYAGVGKNECSGTPPNVVCTSNVIGGRVLRLAIAPTPTCSTAFPPPQTNPPTFNIWNPVTPCWNMSITEVGNTPDGVAAYIAKHNDRMYVTTWPEQSIGPDTISSLYMSPVVPVGGLTAANAAQWQSVWKATDYEPDSVLAITYAGGGLASFDGYLFWGSMHIPWQSIGPFFQTYCPGQTNDPETGPAPCSEEVIKQALAGTQRSIAVFRGRNFELGEGKEIDLLYGDAQLPVFDPTVGEAPGTWVLKPNNMGKSSLYGPSGFGNFFNTYTWAMTVWDNRLIIGTMDWSFLSQQGAELLSSSLPPDLYQYAKNGGDLMYVPSANSPAYPESTNGIGNPTSYGIRTMVPGGGTLGPNLTVGMANAMNLLTDPADPHGYGGLGGWELLQLKPTGLQNTAVGAGVLVNLANGVSVNYCNVSRAGQTVSAYLENPFLASEAAKEWYLERYDLDGPDMTAAAAPATNQLVYLASTANWREGCASPALATVCVPRPGSMAVPRLHELRWSGTNYNWIDVTSSADAGQVCGHASAKNVGAFSLMDLAFTLGVTPNPNESRPHTMHTATAKVAALVGGAPLADVTVNFLVQSGPNAGTAGSATTNAAGEAAFSYMDASTGPYPKSDVIAATVGTTTRTATQVWVLRCDADSDLDIDATDLNIIRMANGKPVSSPYDARDGNKDQLINVSDYQYCRLRLGQ